jgi:uncharacterized SAM-binding protein YcdF (DUF218 family)
MMVLSKLLPLFVYPLGFAFSMVVFALIMFRLQKTKLAYVAAIAALLVLYVSSITPVSTWIVGSLESRHKAVRPGSVKADAIVVLGGPGRPKKGARQFIEFGESGERIFDGIRWWKSGASPVVITSGGGIDFIQKDQKEGEDLKNLMIEFGVPKSAILAENAARNTYENALYVRALMIEKGMSLRVILVTSAIHMPRSLAIFKKAGFDAVPAPCDFIAEPYQANWFSFLPKSDNINLTTQALKEYIGIVTYKMLGWL